MEHNRLPETESYSPEAKLTYDAKGLVRKAELQSERLGTPVDPINFAQRGDDGISTLRGAIAKEQRAIATAGPEAVELDPRLTTFKADFDADPALKAKCPWAEIQSRLLANGGHYLALAQAMEQGGELFGVDKEGNPLISDRGDEPIMTGMNYKDTRDRVLYKHDRLDKTGKMVLKDKQPVSTGYEMLPYSGDYDKSDEILQYEAHTGKPFVKSLNGDEWRSSWVESGENPSWPRLVGFAPDFGSAGVHRDYPQDDAPNRGVRRLLRVKKA